MGGGPWRASSRRSTSDGVPEASRTGRPSFPTPPVLAPSPRLGVPPAPPRPSSPQYLARIPVPILLPRRHAVLQRGPFTGQVTPLPSQRGRGFPHGTGRIQPPTEALHNGVLLSGCLRGGPGQRHATAARCRCHRSSRLAWRPGRGASPSCWLGPPPCAPTCWRSSTGLQSRMGRAFTRPQSWSPACPRPVNPSSYAREAPCRRLKAPLGRSRAPSSTPSSSSCAARRSTPSFAPCRWAPD